jgi:hypothetical protein
MGERGALRLGGKPKKEVCIQAGAKELEIERRRKAAAGTRRDK